ncbi:Rieske (2Fe-2S) protein [Nocardia sp. NBC_00565]|uniref:QcrA and Rieske domain-containing protein n=1 Tax=Nocardia sp. NBC_00565 TaxID=2975993 RepID=UPI002E80B8D2|nr:Rieske (2Fe-2S) protein [Nocardia sp. NBC_00565]WUC04415.1 Rieske (2Fe-2S) protein [Nocardia sp. NBC_00565]
MTNNELAINRRTVVIAGASAAAAAAALTACTTYGKSDTAQADPPKPAAGSSGPNVAAGQPNPNAIASTGEVPVGGGVIKGNVVVTQPSAGSFVGLSSTCTHAGCKVATIAGGTINCACHGSKFGLDGSVVNGPATQPLAAKAIRVDGDSIVAG